MSCTTVLVGKLASNDGSTMIARTDDGFFDVKKTVVVEPSDQPRKYKSKIGKIEIDLPDDPMRYTASPDVGNSDGIWAATGINAANVGMTATETITTNPRVIAADPLIDSVKLTQDIAEPVELNNVSNKTIDAQGNSAVFEVEATATLNNVVIKNLVDDDGGVSAITIKSGAKGDLTLENCVIGDGEQRPINGASNPDLSLTLKECEVSNYNYAAYFYALKNLVLEECIFNGSAANSWAVLINGDIKGNFTVNKCTFNGCNDGIVKAGVGGNNLDGTVGKVFTFTNNILTNCAGHDGVDAKMFGIKYVVTPVISGNTFNGAAWAEIETNYNSYGVVAK